MSNFKILLSAPAEYAEKAAEKYPVSVMAYRMGRGFHLYRTSLPQVRLYMMDIDCSGFTGFGPHEVLVSEIVRECFHYGYHGISLSLSVKPSPQLLSFCGLLSKAAEYDGLSLYLPESFSRASDTAKILLPAQNTSGLYSQRLNALCSRFGKDRVALEFERVYTDFALPVRSGSGSILSQQHFDELSGAGRPFYSGELMANYLSYSSGGRAHLILWDDVSSIRQKLSAAKSAGITEAFFYYPHVADIIDEIQI